MIQKLFLTTAVMMTIVSPIAPRVFAEESDVQQLEAKLSSELQKVNTKYQEIENLNQRINELDAEKASLAEQIKTQEVKVDERKEVARKRLQLMQASDLVSYSILHLLNSESISDFLNRLFVFQQFFQSDEEVLQNLADQVKELNRLKSESESTATDLEGKKEQLTAETKTFEGSIASLKQLIADNKATFEKMEQEKKAAADSATTIFSAMKHTVATASADQTKADEKKTQEPTAQTATTVQQEQPAQQSSTSTTNNSSSSSNSSSTSGKTLQVVATGYSYNEAGLSYYTSTGIDLRSNPTVIAVDPSVIPLGSLVEIPGYGVAIAGDTGSAIKGNIIDLHFVNVNDALQWGRRTVTIKILN